MQITITTIIFGLPSGQRTDRLCLTLPMDALPLRDLIAQKIRQEVAECQAKQRPGLSGEHCLPAVLIRARSREALAPSAVEAEIAHAQQAFAARDYMIVIDNQRIDDADAIVALSPDARIEFIKILPIVGG
ncbi:MAG: hypothetical protein O7G88_05520 [bacterium]|nr:hypothetical protein [bacterium]